MKKILLLSLLLPLILTAQLPSIIPQPISIKLTGGNFILDDETGIKYNPTEKDIKQAAIFFKNAVKNISGFDLTINSTVKKNIQFKIEKIAALGQEGYQLNVSSKNILIKANSKAGIIYAIQTLLQTLPAIRTNAVLQIPCMNVEDYPSFKWRGMHLDVSRHFFGPDFIKEYIDLIASYKMNVFHWHLTDDQGWRIEIKKYPLLTSIGAWRVDETDKVWGERPQAKAGEKATYGGYYTQQQLKEIVAYAAARNVTIVPEIEMPGHAAAAIASYPNLSCTKMPQLPMTGGNYTNIASNYCAGNDSVLTFLQNVLTEVMAIFPSSFIHIGGDEVDKGPWKNCAKCQARIKSEGLKDENELQSYFIKRIEKFIVSKKRKMIGWDEILEGGLAPEATVMSWRGEAGGIAAAKMKHDVVMTPGTPVYFDHYQAGPQGEPHAIGGFNSVKMVYDYEPIPNELKAEENKYVLGAQANLWTEFITTTEHVEYMILPRMPALAEVLWSSKENRNWENFSERLQNHFKTFGQKGLHYSAGNFTVSIKPLLQQGKLFVALSTEVLNGKIFYTIDGSEPSINSNEYTSLVPITTSLVLKASVAVNGNIMGIQAAKQNFVMHKAIASPVTYINPVSKYYLADGPNSLTDGIRGNESVNKYWHGFSEKDMIAIVDLGTLKNIHTITLGCLQSYNDWIFLPQSVKFETSLDGIIFSELKSMDSPIDIKQKKAQFDFKISFAQQEVRYIRVSAKNNLCPAGHSGAGQPGWIFADELIVE
ncbi:MAG: family 20 glycosylhydrolase [Ferruginibacter sp.]